MKQNIDWKKRVTEMISDYICRYVSESGTPMRWKSPLVGFADANSPEFAGLKQTVHKEHAVPGDVLEDATIVVSYFLPYPEDIAESNRSPEPSEGRNSGSEEPALKVEDFCVPGASSQWAMAYRETNILFGKLNDYLIGELQKLDQQGQPARSDEDAIRAAAPQAFTPMDGGTLTSRWSQRHVARIAGLGTFGMNNMLITPEGCCGRFSSIVTNLRTPADAIQREEACLYKRSSHHPACGLCIRRCPSGALTAEGFDRFLCEKVCDANQAFHDPNNAYGTDSSVCGKCLTGLPCSFRRP